ncbi:bifunctional diguanylate cyclase/phosphodiesterase [Undibacterium curvum]|uniref:bifunctional diguanylate cyclase/phosphodiesterase n=1 Tax=Undibacterium curvum TaxID=2762294 RepID=UPI003D0C002D
MSISSHIKRTNSRIWAALAFCMAMTCSVTIISKLEQAEQREQHNQASELALMQAHTLEHKLAHALSACYAVGAFIQQNQGKTEGFAKFAEQLLEYHPGINAIYLAPGGITQLVVPASLSSVGLGIDLIHDNSRKTEALLAIQSKQLSLAGPLELKRGGAGVIGRLPIYLNDASGKETLWGIVSVVIPLPQILSDAELPELARRGHQYELWRIHPETGTKQIIDQSAHFSDKGSVRHSFSLPNTTWILDVNISNVKGFAYARPLKFGIALLLSAMLAAMTHLLLSAREQKKGLRKLVSLRTGELVAREKDLQRAQSISQTGSWIADLSTMEIRGTEQAFRIWGLGQRTTISCESVLAQIHPEDRAIALAGWQQARQGHAASVEYRLQIGDQLKWVHSQIEHDHDPVTAVMRCIGTVQDITERKKIENDLRIAAIAFEGQEGIVITDQHRNILRINQAFTRITGYERDEVLGKTTSLLKSGIHGSAYYADMAQQLETQGLWQGEIWNRRKNGEIYPEWLTITAIRSADGGIVNYVGTMLDITQRKATEAKLEHLAYHDPLTGLANRRLLLDRLQHALVSNARSHRYGAILFLDLDNFKTINDTSGHGKGDLLLQQIAKRLQVRTGKGDTLARIGGDEFIIILEDLSENLRDTAIEVRSFASAILEDIKRPFDLDGHPFHTTASIGIDLFGTSETCAENMLKQVEVAMYEAKAEGGDHICFFNPDMLNIIAARAAMENDIRIGINERQFTLFYQPQVNSAGKWIGAEALIRWRHPEKGMISPAEFIPLAEESGLIIPLGNWVIQEACLQLKSWSDQAASAHLTLAVNVSAKQFRQADFVDVVLSALDSSDADPRKLKIELTESVLVDNVEEIIAKMQLLKSHGVCFSLDDFGTGYSSLTYLKKLPLDQLKIDQSFVRDILINPNDAAITRTIIGLGKSLGLAVIAEGVETEAQRTFLQSQDCHAFQGYLFGKPSATLDIPHKTPLAV